MELDAPQQEEVAQAEEVVVEPAPVVSNRFLFVDIAALRAKQLRRGARARLEHGAHDSHPQPHKAERVAMEEVRRRLVQYDLPPAKPAVNPEASA
jgi:DNA-directed RNA polymerase subunit K/omega